MGDRVERRGSMRKSAGKIAYQKGVVKRYYEHKDDLMVQKLGELVGDLFLSPGPKESDRLWERAKKALLNAGGNKARVETICRNRDLEGLAKIVQQIF